MDNQKDKNEEAIDLSRMPVREEKKSIPQPGSSNSGSFKKTRQGMGNKNLIFILIIGTSLIAAIALLIFLFGGAGKEVAPSLKYAPPAQYPPGVEYAPPFP